MTYSRPGTSEVNAFFRPATPNRLTGAPDQRVSLGSSGPLLDNRNAATAGRNAGQGFAEVASFLDQFTKTAAPIYNAYADQQAKKQVGELFSNMDVATLYRSGDQKARDAVKAMSPRAQEIANEALAQANASEFVQRVSVNTANSRILTNPQSSQEEMAAERLRIRDYAMEGSGLKALPPQYVAPLIPEIAQQEAAIRGRSYEGLAANTVQQQNARNRRKIGTDIEGMTAEKEQLLAQQDIEGAVQYKRQSREHIKNLAKVYAKEGIYTSVEFAEEFALSVADRVDFYVGRGDFDKADALLRNIDSWADDGIILGEGTASPVDLFDLSINAAGRTLRSYISDAQTNLKPLAEEYERKQALKSVGGLFVRAIRGDTSARAELESRAGEWQNSPDALREIVSQFNQYESFGQQLTGQRGDQYLDLLQDANTPGRNRDQITARIRSSGLPVERQAQLLLQNLQEDSDSPASNAAWAKTQSEDLIEQAALDITRRQLAKDSSGRMINPNFAGVTFETQLDENRRKLRIQAARQTEERIKNSDKPVSREDTLGIYRNELEALRNSRLKSAGEAAPEALSFDQRVLGEVNEVQANMQRLGQGNYETIKIYPQSVIDGARARGVPMDYKNVTKYFLNRMGAAKNSKGEQQFSNPQEEFRRMIQRIPGPPTKGTTGQSSLNIPMDAMSAFGLGMVQPGNALASLSSLLSKVGIDLSGASAVPTAARAPKPSSGQGAVKPQQQQAQPARQQSPQQELARQVVGGGLAVLAGVPEAPPTPAAAKPSLADMVINSENLAAMASLWRNERPMSVRTPALPQVVASAPAASVPLAISSDRHPIMVAIGINEGTRTADGGYTRAYFGHRDPGNGKLNVGTVSGQQGGSPQSSDRRWMGTLTNTAAKVASLLQRMGIKRNSVGFNRLLFNALDLSVQATPPALSDFLKRLPRIIQAGVTIEAIAKARADSFFNPATGRLEASGFGNNYARLLADQRSRAGTFDYKRRG